MTQKLIYTHEELLAEQPYATRIRWRNTLFHGGLDAREQYLPLRSRYRPQAIAAWTAQLAAQGHPIQAIHPDQLRVAFFPTVEQSKLLLRHEARGAMTRILTLIGVTEGFGNDGIRAFPRPDLQPLFKESIEHTALSHLYTGLFEAHGNDEAGCGNEAGHDAMWYVIRDAALNSPRITPDMFENLPLAPPPGYQGPAKAAPDALSISSGFQFQFPVLEALRKPSCGSIITEFTLGRRSKFAEHQMNVAHLDHRGGGFRLAFIVFAVPSRPPIPRIRALHHPAFAHGREPFASFWPGFHFHAPARTILCQPLLERMIVILGIAKDRLQTGTILLTDLRQQLDGGYAIINLRARNHHGEQQPQRIDEQMTLASLDFLATVVPPCFSTDFGRLHRLTINARGAGRRLSSRFPAHALPYRRQYLGPGPVITPLRKIVIHTTLGEQVMGQHLPLAAAAVQIQERIEHLAHIEFPRTASPIIARSRNQGREDRPLRIREIRRIGLPLSVFSFHPCLLTMVSLLCASLFIIAVAKVSFRRAS